MEDLFYSNAGFIHKVAKLCAGLWNILLIKLRTYGMSLQFKIKYGGVGDGI